MFDITADLEVDDDIMRQIQEVVAELGNTEVLVGIPEDEAARNDGNGNVINNAALLYIHTNGSPKNNIPPRPVIEPALSDDENSERIGEIMGEAVNSAMAGDADGMRENLAKAGMAGQNAVKDWFTNPKNGWQPVKPETARRKERRGATEQRPLIDTGELRNALTYVVREKE